MACSEGQDRPKAFKKKKKKNDKEYSIKKGSCVFQVLTCSF